MATSPRNRKTPTKCAPNKKTNSKSTPGKRRSPSQAKLIKREPGTPGQSTMEEFFRPSRGMLSQSSRVIAEDESHEDSDPGLSRPRLAVQTVNFPGREQSQYSASSDPLPWPFAPDHPRSASATQIRPVQQPERPRGGLYDADTSSQSSDIKTSIEQSPLPAALPFPPLKLSPKRPHEEHDKSDESSESVLELTANAKRLNTGTTVTKLRPFTHGSSNEASAAGHGVEIIQPSELQPPALSPFVLSEHGSGLGGGPWRSVSMSDMTANSLYNTDEIMPSSPPSVQVASSRAQRPLHTPPQPIGHTMSDSERSHNTSSPVYSSGLGSANIEKPPRGGFGGGGRSLRILLSEIPETQQDEALVDSSAIPVYESAPINSSSASNSLPAIHPVGDFGLTKLQDEIVEKERELESLQRLLLDYKSEQREPALGLHSYGEDELLEANQSITWRQQMIESQIWLATQTLATAQERKLEHYYKERAQAHQNLLKTTCSASEQVQHDKEVQDALDAVKSARAELVVQQDANRATLDEDDFGRRIRRNERLKALNEEIDLVAAKEAVHHDLANVVRQLELRRELATIKDEILASLAHRNSPTPGLLASDIARLSQMETETDSLNNMAHPATVEWQATLPSGPQILSPVHNEHSGPPMSSCPRPVNGISTVHGLGIKSAQHQADEFRMRSPQQNDERGYSAELLEDGLSWEDSDIDGPDAEAQATEAFAVPLVSRPVQRNEDQADEDEMHCSQPNNEQGDGIALPQDGLGWEDGDIDGPDGEAQAAEAFAVPLIPRLAQRNKEKQAKAAKLLLEDLNTHMLVCLPEVHRQKHEAHMFYEDENHHRITETYNALDATDLREYKHGLKTENFPDLNGPKPTAEEVQDMRREMEGIHLDANGNETPLKKNICLHMEAPDTDSPQSSWDVDSMIMFPSSLAFLKKPLQVYAGKSLTRHLRTNIHLMKQCEVRNIDDSVTTQNLPLKDIPHTYFGSVVADVPCDVLVFFPKMVAAHGHKFKYLTDRQWNTFCDAILYPAMDCMGATARQKVPASNSAARAAASALSGFEKYDESADLHDIALRNAKNAGHYVICAKDLMVVHDRMRGILDAADNRALVDYRDFFFMCSNKDMKASHGSTDGLVNAYDNFTEKFHATYDTSHCAPDQLYLDIAREIVPQRAPEMDRHRRRGIGKVYQWKTCCLEHKYDAIKDTLFDQHAGRRTLFNEGYLRDTGTMTLDPPSRVALETGLVYSQWYNSNKNITDAMKKKPFMQPHLLELCTDPTVFQAQARSANVTNAKRARQDQMQQWINSKYRVREHYAASKHVSYGIRTEHRLSWDLLEMVINLARVSVPLPAGAPRHAANAAGSDDEMEEAAAAEVANAARPDAAEVVPLSYVWCIGGDVYSEFMLGNYDKFVRIWETGYHSQSLRIRMPVSNVEYCLMKLIRNFHNSNIQRMSILKYGDSPLLENVGEADGADSSEKQKYGLGVFDNMKRSGYGWIMERIDFERFVWLDHVAAQMPRICSDWVRWLQQSRVKISETNGQLEIMEGLMTNNWERRVARTELLRLMAHVVCSQFRYDVKKILQKDLRGQACDIDNDHGLYFWWEGIKQHTKDPSLVYSNRTALNTPDLLFKHFWGKVLVDPASGFEFNRKSFETLPFRVAYDTVCGMLGRENANDFVRIFKDEFFQQHSVLPFPNTNGTLCSNSKAVTKRPKKAPVGWVPEPPKRRWFGVKPGQKGSWVWARESPVKTRPPAPMAEARKTAAQIQVYLDGLQDY